MSSNYFQGWYFKHQNKEKTLCFIPGISSENAFIQVITNEASYNINFNKKEFHSGESIKIGNNIFSFDGLKIAINDRNLNINGEIYYKNLTPIRGDIMGGSNTFPCSVNME